MKSTRNALLALVGGSLFAMAAQAGDEPRGCPAKFSEFDLDGDGVVLEQEWTQGHAERMKALAEEGRKMKHAGEMPTFASIDLDGNGQVNEEEFAAHKKAHMHKHMGKHEGKHEGKGEHKGLHMEGKKGEHKCNHKGEHKHEHKAEHKHKHHAKEES